MSITIFSYFPHDLNIIYKVANEPDSIFLAFQF